MCGGQSELNQPDDEAKQILESILDQLREKTGHADDGTFLDFCLVNNCFSHAAWLQNASGGGNKLFSEGVPGRKVNWNVVKIKWFF